MRAPRRRSSVQPARPPTEARRPPRWRTRAIVGLIAVAWVRSVYNQAFPFMHVLVTGATGFTGGQLARALRRRGHRVRALVRPRSLAKARPLEALGIDIVQGDLTDPASLLTAASGIDVVYHVAATYREA